MINNIKLLGCIITLHLSIICNIVFSENWVRVFDDDGKGDAIGATQDGSVMVSGLYSRIIIAKFDSEGNLQARQAYDPPYPCPYRARDIEQVSDDGYIILAGCDWQYGSHPRILRLDSGGNLLWERSFSSPYRQAYSMRSTSDGGIILTGSAYEASVNRGFDLWLCKLDSFGNTQWEKIFGRSIAYENESPSESGFSVAQTADDGYIVAGSYISPNLPPESIGLDKIVLIKLTSSGTIEWQRIYGGNNPLRPASMRLTQDGGYIVVGQYYQIFDAFALKLDASGNIQWQKTYAGQQFQFFQDIKQTADAGYITVGYDHRNPGLWVLRLNSSGSIVWKNRFFSDLLSYLDGDPSVDLSSDGNAYITGTTGYLNLGYTAFAMKISIDNPTLCIEGSSSASSKNTSFQISAGDLLSNDVSSVPSSQLSAPTCLLTPIIDPCNPQSQSALAQSSCSGKTLNFISPADPSKFLIHKYGNYGVTDMYPEGQTEDGKYNIRARVAGAFGQGLNDELVSFRLTDPEDELVFRPDRGPGDNKGPAAILVFPAGSSSDTVLTESVDLNGDKNITEDEKGIARVTLELPIASSPSPFSGNNYKLEASLDNFANIITSPTITNWKRGYIEHTKMYKVGEFLTQTSTAGGQRTILKVRKASTFSRRDAIHVFGGADYTNANKSILVGEYVVVTAVDTNKNEITVEVDANRDGNGDGAGLTLSYPTAGSGTVTDPCSAVYPYSFVARIAGGVYDTTTAISPNTLENSLSDPFNDASVEWRVIGESFIPNWTTVCGGNDSQKAIWAQDIAKHFFQNYVNTPTTNHVQIISASRWDPSLVYGWTDPQPYVSWMFLDALTTRLRIDNTLVHEIGHQWNVNQVGGIGGGHDSNQMCGNTVTCVMRSDPTLLTIPGKFHCILGDPEDLYCIRSHIDDLNQNTCNWP